MADSLIPDQGLIFNYIQIRCRLGLHLMWWLEIKHGKDRKINLVLF